VPGELFPSTQLIYRPDIRLLSTSCFRPYVSLSRH
jgi:hypothetical protein